MKDMRLPKMESRADFLPDTLNEESRSIDVIFTTGAAVRRDSYFDGPFIEELEVSEKAIRLDRFNNGANVLDSHNRYELSSVLGVVERARIENGVGIATIRFSGREEVQPVFQDVKDGVIRNVSVGYTIHKMEKREESSEGIPIFRAVDWEPSELSFVSVPADRGAQVRSDSEVHPCQIITRESTDMKKETTESSKPNVEAPVNQEVRHEAKIDEAAIRQDAVNAERARCEGIRSACVKSKMESDFSERMISEGKTVEAVRELIIDELAKADERTDTNSVNVAVGEDNTRKYVNEGITGALLNKYDRRNELDDNSKKYRSSSLIDLARMSLDAAGVSTRNMDRNQVASMALRSAGYHSSSDFPLILENIVTKTMQRGYEEAPRTWGPLAREVTVPDFKQVSRVHLGEAAQLEQVLEGGEYKHGSMSERAEKYSIKKYGKMVSVTREMLINDDLAAFTRIPAKIGKKARDMESDQVWDLLKNNAQVMAETGSTLFNAAHTNLNEGGAGAISETTLAAMRTAMRLHQDLGGSSPLNLFPSWLFVPAGREVEAAKLLTSLISPDASSNVNVFGQMADFSLKMAVEPRLDGGTNQWYVTADIGQTDMLEVARLAGEEQPMVESREGWNVDGVEFKIRHQFVAHAIDYRGVQRNDGV